MRKLLVLALVAVPALLYATYTATRPARAPMQQEEFDFPVKSKMPPPRLTEPDSPFFSQQVTRGTDGKVVEMRVTYRDGRRAVFAFNAEERLSHVTVYHPDSEVNKAFEAWYNEKGTSITHWMRWREDQTLEKELLREKGREVTTFYGQNGVRVQQVAVLSSGDRVTTDYAADGTTVSASTTTPAGPGEVVLFQRELKGQMVPRLTLRLNGAHIAGWSHVDKDGHVDHTAEFMEDGSLLFAFHNNEGKLTRTQRYEVVGEDWQRQYYRLRESKLYFPDGKTVNHVITMHPNGMQKQHFRYDNKGRLEAIRNFTPNMLETRMEEFDVNTGKTKGLWEWDAEKARRGFVPDGAKGSPDHGDPAGEIYDFGGSPYIDVNKSYTSHPLFRTK